MTRIRDTRHHIGFDKFNYLPRACVRACVRATCASSKRENYSRIEETKGRTFYALYVSSERTNRIKEEWEGGGNGGKRSKSNQYDRDYGARSLCKAWAKRVGRRAAFHGGCG